VRQKHRSRLARWALIPIGLVVSIVLAGCTQAQLNGFLPSEAGVTDHTGTIIGLWTTSWIVLLAVGLVTWGLIIWAAVAYRRRKGQTGLPVQLRYNLPIEIFYTIVPLILVLGFFAFTARDQAEIEANNDPEVHIQVYGKRWAWDFNYVDSNVYSPGIQAQEIDAEPGAVNEDELPVLYLPVGKRVEINIESRDVIHSFWILDFLYKKDMIPAKSNYLYFIPLKEGTYHGKCAELCGEYHSLMLFTVKVVSEEEYEHQMQLLEDQGYTGQLGPEYNVNTNLPGNGGEGVEGQDSDPKENK
jgi:cytochrome c oxidase subunit II